MRLDSPNDEVHGVLRGRLRRWVADRRRTFQAQIRLRPGPRVRAEILRAPPEPFLGVEPRLSRAHQRLTDTRERRNVGAASQLELTEGIGRAFFHPRVAWNHRHAEHLYTRRVEQHEERDGVIVQHPHVCVDDDMLGRGAAPARRESDRRKQSDGETRTARDHVGETVITKHAAPAIGHECGYLYPISRDTVRAWPHAQPSGALKSGRLAQHADDNGLKSPAPERRSR